jgi:peptidoglycan/xylan/chitin deacetylase (PgdA/CDA1 family)
MTRQAKRRLRDHCPDFGAFVVSLDFELQWGVRATLARDGGYRENLRGAREAIPQMLRLFEEFEIAATWAAVGLLFATSRLESESFRPGLQPLYRDGSLNPYREPVGEDEEDDPFHYAPSLIDAIRSTPRQEIGTHTFGHYHCLAPGQTADEFRADLRSAIAIAAKQGIAIRSIVFPRNEHNPAYDLLLKEAGILCYRGNPWLYARSDAGVPARVLRAARLLDAHVALPGTTFAWERLMQPNGLCNVPGSLFLRPIDERSAGAIPRLRLKRVLAGLRRAADRREVFHLWWHPHNFGAQLEVNLALLRVMLESFAEQRARGSVRSFSMHEVGAIVRGNL